MKSFIESLENRTLFSVSAHAVAPAAVSPVTVAGDEQKLLTDAKAAVADLRTAVATYHTQTATLAADVKALPATKTNKSLISRISKDNTGAAAQEKADVSHLVSVDESAVRAAVSDALLDYASPTAAHNAKLAKAITSAETLASKPLAKLQSDLNASATKLNGDLNSLAAANPTATQLNSDITTAQNAENSARATLSGDVTLVQTDLNTLVTDLQA